MLACVYMPRETQMIPNVTVHHSHAIFDVSKLAELVKKVNCQYTFGVDTRWDESKRNKTEGDGRASLGNIRKKYEEKYRKMIAIGKEDKDQVFFVNVKSVQEIKVSVSSSKCLSSSC